MMTVLMFLLLLGLTISPLLYVNRVADSSEVPVPEDRAYDRRL